MWSLHARKKIPAEGLPLRIGVEAAVHVRALSAEWKTRAAGPPVAKRRSFCLGPQRISEVLLAAKRPSVGRADGSKASGISVQCSPSSVRRMGNLPSMGSLMAKQIFSVRQARASRKKAGRGAEY